MQVQRNNSLPVPDHGSELDSVRSEFNSHFVLPDPEKSFVALHDRIERALKEDKHVLLFQIDGWGYDQALAEIVKPEQILLRTIEQEGIFSQNVAQWPATTAVQMTTLHTALPLEMHGVIEWVMYDSRLGRILSPLTFSPPRSCHRDSLLSEGISPKDVLPVESFYEKLQGLGFGAYHATKERYLRSAYQSAVGHGATPLPIKNFSEGCEQVAHLFSREERASYCLFYWDDLDKTNHMETKNSLASSELLSAFLEEIHKTILKTELPLTRDLVVILTSDHGHMTINQGETWYVNELIPNMDSFLIPSSQGGIIPCSGGYRSLFLHAKEERREELLSLLKEALLDHALVLPTEILFELKVFDKNIASELFLSRLGNIVVLPFSGETVYYSGPEGFRLQKASVHGGASAEEMFTPYFEIEVQKKSL